MNIEYEKLKQSQSYQLSRYAECQSILDDAITELADMLKQTKEYTAKLVEGILNYYHYHTTNEMPEMDPAVFQTVVHVTQPFRIPYMTYRFDKYINFLKSNRDIKTVLDYGGGGGKDSIILSRLGYDVTYADIIGPLTPYIKKRFELRGLNNDIIDVRFLGDNRYDCIVSLDVLEHIYDMEYVLADIYARIRPGGILICHPTFVNSWDGDHVEKNSAYSSYFHKIIYKIGFKPGIPEKQSVYDTILRFFQELKILPYRVRDYCLIKDKKYSDSIKTERDIVRKELYILSKKYSLQTLLITVLLMPVSLSSGLFLISFPLERTRFIGKIILQNLYNNIADNLAVYRLSNHRLSELEK